MSSIDATALQAWVGRQEARVDVITTAPVAGLSATLDYPSALAEHGQPLPLPWHWLYFLPSPAASEVALDGHPQRGGFLPPVPLPRRMWAGSSLRFIAPLRVGDAVRRVSTIAEVVHKLGASGDLVFVKLRHQVFSGDQLAIEEDQDLVYRQASTSNTVPVAKPAPLPAQWSREVLPDPVLLFRYSALTFNSHRIHYDRDYAREQEGYAGLVVQGPLTATLLLDLLRREMPQAEIETFSFRGVRPLLDGRPFMLQGAVDQGGVRLWALDASGALAMDARVGLL